QASGDLTLEMIQQAEWIAGITLAEADRKSILARLKQSLRNFKLMRDIALTNDVPPAVVFNPAPWLPPAAAGRGNGTIEPVTKGTTHRPDTPDELAFLPVSALAALVRRKQISSVELTKLYLDRLHKYDPALKCVVTLTDELAMKQAQEADREIAAG